MQPNHTHDTDPQGWRMRVNEVRRVLDHLALVEAGFTIDRDRIAVAGHSFGGQTAGNLLGLQVEETDLSDPRVKAGVLLATAGRGADLTPYAAEHYPFMRPRFDHMSTPALVVAGDNDSSPFSTRGPAWMTDPYHLSPGPKSLLMVPGGEHSLGGIPGYDARETTDASPERLDLVRRVTLAYLQHALGIDDTDWKSADVEQEFRRRTPPDASRSVFSAF